MTDTQKSRTLLSEPNISQETWKETGQLRHLEEQDGQETNSYNFALYKYRH